ncbi:MAG TPA: CopG family transcriptional regulator [Xanthomonadales bacterium]|nr:CopG family transcriptional regulator [Xanthomonadales bacterium]
MKAKTFDRKFDEGKDITEALDLSKARRPLQAQKRVNVDFPTWMVRELDLEASRVGVTRQSIIKMWLAERLENSATNKSFKRDALKGAP